MNVRELIEQLSKFDPEAKVVIDVDDPHEGTIHKELEKVLLMDPGDVTLSVYLVDWKMNDKLSEEDKKKFIVLYGVNY